MPMTPLLAVPLVAASLLAAASAAPAVRVSRPDLMTVVDRVQKRYDAAADFRARFNQTLTNAAFKRKTTSTGELLLNKPSRMRLTCNDTETNEIYT